MEKLLIIIHFLGPAESGKSTFLKHLIKVRAAVFTTNFIRILLFVPQDMLHLHNKFLEEVRSYFPHLEVIGGLPKSNDIYDDLLPKLLIMDDLMSELFREAEIFP